jgi:succinyl-diaminopimelate desuccinylase
MWVEVAFTGESTHGSVPEQGVNAIYHAARFVRAVEGTLVPRLRGRVHPSLGPATVNVGVISGGDRPPMVPAACQVQLDRRWLPGERHGEVLDEIQSLADRLRDEDQGVDAVAREMGGTSGFVHSPLECPSSHPGLRLLGSVTAALTGAESDPVGVQFWTDGALLAAETGTPTVVCGPGDIAQAHSLDEWVSLAQLEAAASIYVRFASRYLDAMIVEGAPADRRAIAEGDAHDGHQL